MALLNAVKSKDETEIFINMKPLLYKSIKTAPYDDQDDYYQELSIEIIKTIRKQYRNEHEYFFKFLKKNKLICGKSCYLS